MKKYDPAMHVYITLHSISIAIDIKLTPTQWNRQVTEFLVLVIKTLLWLIGLDSIISINSVFLLAILMQVKWWTRVCSILCDQSVVMDWIPAVDFYKSNSTVEGELTKDYLRLDRRKSTEHRKQLALKPSTFNAVARACRKGISSSKDEDIDGAKIDSGRG